jgi:ABC-2 type transport system ATP-binding protein
MIEIQDLSRAYGDVEAVRGLTLTVPPGEIFGLLGPNGAGKSTTLKVLATLLKPTGGAARVCGHDVVADAEGVRRAIGYAPEGAHLYEALSGDEFLDLVRDLHRLDPAAAAAGRARLAEAFDLADALPTTIATYSKGMKQKLVLMAALQHEPRVLLLDEPLDGLDVASQQALKGILRRFVADGGAVIYSSHILEVVERLCDRVGILHHGRLVALGLPSELTAASGGTLSEVFLALTDDGGAGRREGAGRDLGAARGAQSPTAR